MSYTTIYNLYLKSPGFINRMFTIIPLKYRLGGKSFIQMYDFLKQSQTWSKKEIVQCQRKFLDELLNHAVKHVPFYSDITLHSDNPFENLKNFPVVTKDVVRDNFNDFQADNIPRRNTFRVTTSGTTNDTFFDFYLHNSTYGKEWAFVITAWERAGFNLGDKIVSIRGSSFTNGKKNVFWRYNPFYNMMEFSSFHMNQENLPKYVKKIKEISPKFIHGYPSAITILARYLHHTGEKINGIKAILPASETIYPGQRKLIEQAFNARLFSFYGQAEKVIMAAECEHSSNYHTFPEYGFTEILDDSNNPVNDNERGKLVGTGFLNYYMPFIRYNTNDFATLVDGICDCGRYSTILKDLKGRSSEDYVVVNENHLIPMTSVYHIIHSESFDNIFHYQFVQEQLGELILKIEPSSDFTVSDEMKIRDEFKKIVGDEIKLFIEIVDHVKLSKMGKSKLFIQKILDLKNLM